MGLPPFGGEDGRSLMPVPQVPPPGFFYPEALPGVPGLRYGFEELVNALLVPVADLEPELIDLTVSDDDDDDKENIPPIPRKFITPSFISVSLFVLVVIFGLCLLQMLVEFLFPPPFHTHFCFFV